ncbi:MAG: right-handed parallel beta-helix repeat-containing protein [Phycisphaeraceae bacterium]|nr:MAG: right-handed parallel beta-helix repeat-containing protein [Phycisphaeraceae bacterium]
MKRTSSVLATAAVLALGGVMSVSAGPVDPPVGPIQSTMKTLGEVEPRTPINTETCPGDANSIFRIAQPGSYYLTANLQGASGFSGIEIGADNVTIDLCGFTLRGGGGSSLDGITMSGGHRGIAVLNGKVEFWSGNGVNLALAASSRVSGVFAIDNSLAGITVGSASMVTDCQTHGNDDWGFLASNNCVLRDCVSAYDGKGISADYASLIERCSVSNSHAQGFTVYSGCVLQRCSALTNTNYGFWLGAKSIARDCSAGSNGDHGFVPQSNCSLKGCTSNTNGKSGFFLAQGCDISECYASDNSLHGIDCGDDCTVTGNTCRGNGVGAQHGSGIHIASGVIRVLLEHNICTRNHWGVQIAGLDNFVVGNRCTMNATSFDIVQGNRVGAIIVLPLAGPIGGNAGGDSAGGSSLSNIAY